jgi:hypothetical protein
MEDFIESVVEKQSSQNDKLQDPWDYFRNRTINVGIIPCAVLQEYM